LLVRNGRVSQAAGDELLNRALRLIHNRIAVVPAERYKALEGKALKRIPRDPDDWPTVAAALILEAGIWTRDADFLGCGCAT
jgi:predicted nucleic acid-binding protein